MEELLELVLAEEFISFMVVACGVLVASSALAFATPGNSASLGYDFYDFATQLSNGAMGMAIAMGGIVAGGFFVFKQQVMPALGTIFGGIAVYKAGAIATSLGVIV